MHRFSIKITYLSPPSFITFRDKRPVFLFTPKNVWYHSAYSHRNKARTGSVIEAKLRWKATGKAQHRFPKLFPSFSIQKVFFWNVETLLLYVNERILLEKLIYFFFSSLCVVCGSFRVFVFACLCIELLYSDIFSFDFEAKVFVRTVCVCYLVLKTDQMRSTEQSNHSLTHRCMSIRYV